MSITKSCTNCVYVSENEKEEPCLSCLAGEDLPKFKPLWEIDKREKEIDSLRAENERLRGLLTDAKQRGIRHVESCAHFHRGECDCGLEELRKAVDDALKEGEG